MTTFPLNLHELHLDVKFPTDMVLRIAISHYWFARGLLSDWCIADEDGTIHNPFACETGCTFRTVPNLEEFVKCH